MNNRLIIIGVVIVAALYVLNVAARKGELAR